MPLLNVKLMNTRGKTSETGVLERVCREMKRMKEMTETQCTRLSTVFGSRFVKAQEALNERRIKKYVFEPSGRIVWIVVGREREYIVMPAADFCSCDDFYFRAMDRKIHLCYHLIAQKLAEALETYDLVEENDQLYKSLIKEWKEVTP